MMSRKAMTKILYVNSEKSFLECEKMATETSSGTYSARIFFTFVLLISNHTVFLSFNLKIICIYEFFKSSLVQINSKLNSKPYDYLYQHNCTSKQLFFKTTSECRQFFLKKEISISTYTFINGKLNIIGLSG